VVAGIPVLIADDTTREAMHQLEAEQREQALFTLLGLDDARRMSFQSLMQHPRPTYRDALAILSLDAEADCFLYRFSDPTFVMIEALLMGLGQAGTLDPRPVLDLCGGSGHLTRVLVGLESAGGVINADVYFWKLWMARRFTSPLSDAICCDANNPLPFVRDACSLVVLADAFPYIWHKRLLAEEMMRAVGPRGVIMLPHLHSSLGENFSAGMTLTPAGYASLLEPHAPRLFSDEHLFDGVLNQRTVDLTRSASPAEIGTEPSFTLVASRRDDLFRKYVVKDPREIQGELKVNPLYRIDLQGDTSVLTLTFPTPEYEEEFGACKQYLPSTVTVPGDLTGPIVPGALGPQYDELRRRRVIIDAPPDYC
jgi:SAM-dependent methyltransferase